MRTNLKQLLTIVMFFAFFSSFQAQNSFWTEKKEADLSENPKVDRNSHPEKYKIFHLNLPAFKQALQDAPVRGQIQGQSPLIISFPNSQGNLERFRVVESPIMPEVLAAKFETIKTYTAVGIDDPTATMKISVTQFGVHTMNLSGKNPQTFIDPFTVDTENYIVYAKKDLPIDKRTFECLTEEGEELNAAFERGSYDTFSVDADDSVLKKYRLALSAHQDYGDVFSANSEPGEEKADIMAQMVIAINRVNGIYERDLAITLEFIENNDDLIFYSGIGENPWEGADGFMDFWLGTFNERTQEVNDEIIGDENYDIGHNFNTSGGGNAGCIGCVCVSGKKGSGYTGLPNPVGDSFYIDFVAHEMGHQFGGYHVMNTCSRSGNGSTEVEPASGSTIMGYAGVCDYNIQYYSDSHFNFVNIRDIKANIQQGPSSNCPEEITIENQAPTANAGGNYVIPKSTAFVLTGEADDPDGTETLTYEWNQNDPQQANTAGPLNPNLTMGAIYRAYTPKETPERYFPPILAVLQGNLSTNWEVTPNVGRIMNFSFVVRDNGSGFADAIGQVATDNMSITVDANSGPFKVTSQDQTEEGWPFNGVKYVRWDVANTDNSAVDAQEVDVLLSVDGGANFDIVLAEGVPNNGEVQVVAPEIETIHARIMVRATNNVFYAVNEAAFTISSSLEVEQNELEKMTFYPNPSEGVFNISLNPVYGEHVQVQVFDLQGRQIYQQEFDASSNLEKQIKLKNAESGMYILRVQNGDYSATKKLIVK